MQDSTSTIYIATTERHSWNTNHDKPNRCFTTQSTLSKVEAFIANGGNVLYTGSDVLSYNEYEQKMSNTAIINGGKAYTLSNLPSAKIVVKNADGSSADGVEWKYSVTDDRILVNAVNMTESDKAVEIYYNGEKLTAMNELIGGSKGIDTVSLNAYEPQLLEYKIVTLQKPDVADLYFDDVRKAICWKTVGADVAGVNIYKYNSDNTISYIGKSAGDEYFYGEAGTYLVCPVLKNGTESGGRVITTVDAVAEANVLEAVGRNVKVRVDNIAGHYIRVKVLAELLDSQQKVIASGYGKTFIAPDSHHNIEMSLSAEGEADTLRVTVYDDMDNCLDEKIKEIK